MFLDEHDKHDADRKEPSLDLVGLVFIGVLLAIPMVLYLISL